MSVLMQNIRAIQACKAMIDRQLKEFVGTSWGFYKKKFKPEKLTYLFYPFLLNPKTRIVEVSDNVVYIGLDIKSSIAFNGHSAPYMTPMKDSQLQELLDNFRLVGGHVDIKEYGLNLRNIKYIPLVIIEWREERNFYAVSLHDAIDIYYSGIVNLAEFIAVPGEGMYKSINLRDFLVLSTKSSIWKAYNYKSKLDGVEFKSPLER